MKSENDDIEIVINESVKLVETAEHKTYINDTRLHDAEIIDLGIVMTDEESIEDFEEEHQKATPPPAGSTSSYRRKERSPSVEIIDLDIYKPKDKTENVVDKPNVTKETKSKNASNTKKDESDHEIEICDVIKRSPANASKGRKKHLSCEEEKMQAIQQRKENKPFDIKKNQGFVGMKVIKNNIGRKNITKERMIKKRSARVPKDKRLQVTKEILSEIEKQDTRILNQKRKVDIVKTDKINHHSVSKLLEIKKNIIQDLKKLDFKLDINKNILKPSKAVKYVCDNKTPSANASTFKDHQRVSHKKTLAQNTAFESKQSPKSTSQNHKNVIELQKKGDSPKPNKAISIQESKKEERNIDTQNTKHESPKPKKIISIEEYKKAKENVDTTKNNTIRCKEQSKEINKPTCQNYSLEVASKLKIKNFDKITNLEAHKKEREHIDVIMKGTVERKEKSKADYKTIIKNNNSLKITSELQKKNVDEHKKQKENFDIRKKDTIQRKEECKEITKSTSNQNNYTKKSLELQKIDNKVNVDKHHNEKGNIDTTKKDTVQSKKESKEMNKSSPSQNNSIRVTSELQKNKNDNRINVDLHKNEKISINTIKTTDTVRSKEESRNNTSSTSQNNCIRVTSGPQRTDPKDQVNKTQGSRLKLIKPDYLTTTKTKYKNKSNGICPIRNNFTETIKKRVRQLQQRPNKELENVVNKNPLDQPEQSHAKSLAQEIHFQKDSKANPTSKCVKPEAIETPNVSINVNYTSDNKITIEIINTSPKMSKLLASDQQVQKQQVPNSLPTIFTPTPQVSQVLPVKPEASNPPASNSRVPDPHVYPPVSMPLLSDPVRSDQDPVSKRPTSDPQVLNLLVSNPTVPSSKLRALRKSSTSSPSEPLVPNQLASKSRTHNFQEPNQTPIHLDASNSQTTNPQASKILSDLVALNTSVSNTPTADLRKLKLQVADTPTIKLSSLDPLVLNHQLSKPLAPRPQVYNPRGPKLLAPNSPASYPPVPVPLTSMPYFGPNPSLQKSPMPKPLVPDPSLKQAPKSKSTSQPVETREMIEKAVFKYKLGEIYAQQQQMQMNAKDAAYVNNPTDYTTKTVRLPGVPHPPTADLKNNKPKKPLKVLSVKDIGQLYMPRQEDFMHKEHLASISLQNISKLVQNVPVMPKQFPIQPLATDRNNTEHNMPSNYYHPATSAARIYAQQIANSPGTNDPRLQFETYNHYVPYCQNMSCMAPESQLNFATQQNISMYQQPNNYMSYNDQYYPSKMSNYLQSIGYNVPNETAYNPRMGVPEYYDPRRPPPQPYFTQPPLPITIPSQKNESIIGKNNDGVIKKINITAPYKDAWSKNIQLNEPPNQEVKENKINIEQCEDKTKEKSITITPVSTKSEMREVLDNSISDTSISDTSINTDKPDVSVTVTRTNLKRAHESSASDEEKSRSRPCPLSKKTKPNDPITTPEQSGDQINKNIGYSPPILPIPPNYENCFSMPKSAETNNGLGERKPPLTVSSEGLANLLQLSKKDLCKILEKSGYKTKRMNDNE